MVQYVWKYDDDAYVFLNGETATTSNCPSASRAQSFVLEYINDFDGYEQQFNNNVAEYLSSCVTAVDYFNNACYIEMHDYLYFDSIDDDSLLYFNYGTTSTNIEYSYSDDLINWLPFPNAIESAITLTTGERIYVRGVNTTIGTNFVITGAVKAGGNVMSLLDGIGELTTIPSNGCFKSLFKGCTGLITSPELPAEVLTESCYESMFSGCTALYECPKLLAEKMAKKCYQNMFAGCTKLMTACELKSVDLADNCYASMFKGCTHLEYIYDLSAYILKTGCYSSMFNGCSLLRTPMDTLPAIELVSGCYSSMFCNCKSLESCPNILATTTSDHSCQSMFKSCTSITKSPELYAQTIGYQCYDGMFSGCTNLSEITLSATTIGTGCTLNWVAGVSESGTFNVTSSFDRACAVEDTSFVPIGWLNEVNYYDREGNLISEYTEKLLNGSLLTVRTLTDEYYDFVGWCLDEEATGVTWNYATDTINGDLQLYAKMTPKMYTVTFYSGSSTVLKTEQVAYNTPVDEPDDIKVIGLDVFAWFKTSSCKIKDVWDFSTPITGNTYLYAKFTIQTCSIDFETYDRCKILNPATRKYTTSAETYFGTTIPVLRVSSETGYEYKGFYTNSSFTWPFDIASGIVYSDMTLYAKCDPLPYDITYNYYNGDVDTEIYYYNELLDEPTIDVINGYTYDGWYREKSGAVYSDKWDFEEDVVLSSTTLYQNYVINTYIATFNKCNHGGEPQTFEVSGVYNTLIAEPTEISDTNYSLSGWYADKKYRNEWDFNNDKLVSDMTLYAKWIANNYDITINQIFSAETSSTKTIVKKITYNELLGSASDFAVYGYDFDGLYKTYAQGAFSDEWNLDTEKVLSATTLYGKYDAHEFTVSYETYNKCEDIPDSYVPYQSKAVSATPETYSAYLFYGWYTNEDFATKFDFDSPITGDTELYGKFNLNRDYKVCFYKNFPGETGETLVTSGMVYDGCTYTPVPEPTDTDYAFKGWYTDTGGTEPFDVATEPIYAATNLYGKWVKKKKRITIDPVYIINDSIFDSSDITDSAFGYAMGVGTFANNCFSISASTDSSAYSIPDYSGITSVEYTARTSGYNIGITTLNLQNVMGSETVYIPYGYIINGTEHYFSTVDIMNFAIAGNGFTESFENYGAYFNLNFDESDETEEFEIQFIVKANVNNYMTFTLENQNESAALSFWHYERDGSHDEELTSQSESCIYYSYDSYAWNLLPISSRSDATIILSPNSPYVYIAGYNPDSLSTNFNNHYSFKTTSSVYLEVNGNLSSLINFKETVDEIPAEYYFCYLFYGLKIASNSSIVLDLEYLQKLCYAYMFRDTDGLPDYSNGNSKFSFNNSTQVNYGGLAGLFAYTNITYDILTNILPYDSSIGKCYLDGTGDYCYYALFEGCTGLTEAPALTSYEIGDYGYYATFKYCSNLTELPVLDSIRTEDNSSVIGEHCFAYMFYYCTGATGTTTYTLNSYFLKEGCYDYMFTNGNANFNEIICLAMKYYDETYGTQDISKTILSNTTKDWLPKQSGALYVHKNQQTGLPYSAWQDTTGESYGVKYWYLKEIQK